MLLDVLYKSIRNSDHEDGPGPMAIRVLPCDDYEITRPAIAEMLALELDNRISKVIEKAATGAKAVDLARVLGPDRLIMDLKMPVMDASTLRGGFAKRMQGRACWC
jgi:DNA-binding NarL/FixJ family response regulator